MKKADFFRTLRAGLQIDVKPQVDDRVLHSIDSEFERAIRLTQAKSQSGKRVNWKRWSPALIMITLAFVIFLKMDPRPRGLPTPEVITTDEVSTAVNSEWVEWIETSEFLDELSDESGLDLLSASDEEWAILLAEENS